MAGLGYKVKNVNLLWKNIREHDTYNSSRNYHKVVDVHSDVKSATNRLLSHNRNFPNLCESTNYKVYAVFANLINGTFDFYRIPSSQSNSRDLIKLSCRICKADTCCCKKHFSVQY